MRLNTTTVQNILQFSFKVPAKADTAKFRKRKDLTYTEVNYGVLNSSVHRFCACTLYGDAHTFEQYV